MERDCFRVSLGLDQGYDAVDHVRQWQWPDVIREVTRLDAAEVQEIGNNTEQVLLASPNPLHVIQLLGSYRPAESEAQKLGVSADGVERSPKLVRHRGEKLALGQVRRYGLGQAARVFERFQLRITTLGEVSGDLGESQ